MRDLNDKVTGDTLTANEWDDVPSEMQNIIEQLGITLSAADLNQMGKAIAGYVAVGDFYADSGAGGNYVLSVIGTKQGPTEYFDGMRVRFTAASTPTSSSTINVNSLGSKPLKDARGGNLVGEEIVVGVNGLPMAIYVSSVDQFRLVGTVPDLFLANGARLLSKNEADTTIVELLQINELDLIEIGDNDFPGSILNNGNMDLQNHASVTGSLHALTCWAQGKFDNQGAQVGFTNFNISSVTKAGTGDYDITLGDNGTSVLDLLTIAPIREGS